MLAVETARKSASNRFRKMVVAFCNDRRPARAGAGASSPLPADTQGLPHSAQPGPSDHPQRINPAPVRGHDSPDEQHPSHPNRRSFTMSGKRVSAFGLPRSTSQMVQAKCSIFHLLYGVQQCGCQITTPIIFRSGVAIAILVCPSTQRICDVFRYPGFSEGVTKIVSKAMERRFGCLRSDLFEKVRKPFREIVAVKPVEATERSGNSFPRPDPALGSSFPN